MQRRRGELVPIGEVFGGMCCNFQKAARERLVESPGLRHSPFAPLFHISHPLSQTRQAERPNSDQLIARFEADLPRDTVGQTVLPDPVLFSLITYGSSKTIGVEVADRGSTYRSPSRRQRGCRTR